MDKKTNIANILIRVKDIETGLNKNSNIRNQLVIDIHESNINGYFKFQVDLNIDDINEQGYTPEFMSIYKLNKVDKHHLKYLRNEYQKYLGVQWNSKDNKSSIDALRDSFDAYVPMTIWQTKKNKDVLKQKNKSYFAGANNSKIRVNGNYVFEYCERLNKDNDDDISLNFSNVQNVARGYYKEFGGGQSHTNPFDQKIKNISSLIKKDYEAKNPFNSGTAKTEQNISFLTTTCQTWLSQLRNARTNASPKNKVEYKKAI
jgi:hypothetical protein